jgi:DNA-binding CsgD family transcriptional regulator
MLAMIRAGWGGANPAFRRAFTTLFVPDATHEQMEWFDELQRISATPETAALLRLAREEIDVTDLVGQVVTPTLVLHAQDDAAVPFEQGRGVASAIPDARFVPLDGRNHILLADEPAWEVFLRELNAFLPALPRDDDVADDLLTAREMEILRCVAAGMTNEAIARQLFVSVRTVERHMGNMYGKLGLHGKSGRAAIAARAGSLLQDRPDM